MQLINLWVNFVKPKMELTARAYRIVSGNNREFWYEEKCWPEFQEFFALEVEERQLNKSQRLRKDKFRQHIERVLTNTFTRDIFQKECYKGHCIWSMKFFKGNQNTRVFCHYSKSQGKERFTFCALIPKKNHKN